MCADLILPNQGTLLASHALERLASARCCGFYLAWLRIPSDAQGTARQCGAPGNRRRATPRAGRTRDAGVGGGSVRVDAEASAEGPIRSGFRLLPRTPSDRTAPRGGPQAASAS